MADGSTANTDLVISQLEAAKKFTLSQPDQFLNVFKGILPIINSPTQAYPVRQWGVEFMYETFIDNNNNQNNNSNNNNSNNNNNGNDNGTSGSIQLKLNEKVDLAIESLDTLLFLIDLPINLQQQQQHAHQHQQRALHSKIQIQHLDVKTFRHLIDISTIVYKLVFQYVAENDNCNQIWSKLTELKNSLVNKFQTTYPLEKSDNEEHDLVRNIPTKLDLLNFLMTVIDYQSKTKIIGDPVDDSGFSLDRVRPDHTLIKYQNMEYESNTLFTLVLRIFQMDIIIPALLTATINHSVVIIKKKPQLVSALLKAVESYETNSKFQSNYQSVEEFKLSKKYVDRALRIFIGYAKRNGLIPTPIKSALEMKLNVLSDRGNALRKLNILASQNDDTNIRKRKFDGFYNPSKKIKVLDYEHLYKLGASDELSKFDLSLITQPNVHALMVMNALRKVPVQKLTKGLEIICERFKDAVSKSAASNAQLQTTIKSEPGFMDPFTISATANDGLYNKAFKSEIDNKGKGNVGKQNNEVGNTGGKYGEERVKVKVKGKTENEGKREEGEKEEGEEEEDDFDYDDDYDENEFKDEPLFSLPPPQNLSFEEKKEHLSIIIENFLKLAKNPPEKNGVVSVAQELKNNANTDSTAHENPKFNEQLKEVAIKSFNKDTWVIILTRLATRGMRTVAKDEENEKEVLVDRGIYVKDKSPDDQSKEELSNMIREALFNYFVENIHSRVDVVIEWLNEEWYSEQVFYQNCILEEKGKKEKPDETGNETGKETGKENEKRADDDKDSSFRVMNVSTPIYDKWANKVLDAMINYLEPSDKKNFIRLCSDLPSLNEQMLGKIKSLCFDPARSNIGFLALHFLIMYRPPVKTICHKILKELSESDQEDVREEAKKKLARV